jgi:hypothetical protein
MSSQKEVYFTVLEDVQVDDVHLAPGEYYGSLTDRRSDTGSDLPAYVLRTSASLASPPEDPAADAETRPPGRTLDVTAAVSEGKINVREDRGE